MKLFPDSEPRMLFRAVCVTPFLRVAEVPPAGWLAAFSAWILAACRYDALVLPLVLLAATSTVDWLYGSKKARIRGVHRRDLGQLGLLSKGVTAGLVLFVRLVEFWLRERGWPDTDGLISSYLCMALAIGEARSIYRLRGGRGDVLGTVLMLLERITQRGATQPLEAMVKDKEGDDAREK